MTRSVFQLPNNFFNFLTFALEVIATIIVIVVAAPFTGIVIGGTLCITIGLQRFYVVSRNTSASGSNGSHSFFLTCSGRVGKFGEWISSPNRLCRRASSPVPALWYH